MRIFILSIALLFTELSFGKFYKRTVKSVLNPYELILTIDDGPTPQVTDLIRNSLNLYNNYGIYIPATFFVIGQKVNNKRNITDRVFTDGYHIAHHSYEHKSFKRFPFNQKEIGSKLIFADMYWGHQSIRNYISTYPIEQLFFRAPGGGWLPEHADTLNPDFALSKYTGPIGWNIGGSMYFNNDGSVKESADWACWKNKISVEDCAQGYLNESLRKKKGIILIHDVELQTTELLKYLLVAYTKTNLFNNSKYDKFINYFESPYQFIDLKNSQLDVPAVNK